MAAGAQKAWDASALQSGAAKVAKASLLVGMVVSLAVVGLVLHDPTHCLGTAGRATFPHPPPQESGYGHGQGLLGASSGQSTFHSV